MKISQTLYTKNYKPIIEQHDGLIMIENVLTLLSCIYVQKYDYMNDIFFFVSNWSCIHPYIVQWIYCSKIRSLCNGSNSEYNVYNIFTIELGPYVLNTICFILNLINLDNLQLLNKQALQLKKLDTYAF
jgi:hypothetical protein